MNNWLPLISILLSVLALVISGFTFYYSRLQKGRVQMTRPTIIFFGPDGEHLEHLDEKKIYIRTLLYSTADKGQYIQNMFIRLHRGESIQNFNVWVYGDKTLLRGSGLFVSKEGVSSNHHFLLQKDGSTYDFVAGEYQLEVFVETVNKEPYKIFEQALTLTGYQYDEMMERQNAIYYDWAPNSQTYHAHIRGIRKKDIVLDFKNFY